MATEATLVSCPVNLSNEIPRPQQGDFWKNSFTLRGSREEKAAAAAAAAVLCRTLGRGGP